MKFFKNKKQLPPPPLIDEPKYKIEHHLVADVYYAMVYKNGKWLYICPFTDHADTANDVAIAGCKTMEDAEFHIKKWHEQYFKTTVISFDVKINDALSIRQMERLKKFNDVYNSNK